MKKLTFIQQKEQEKKEYHKKQFQLKYPLGCFSLQIRYGRYGFGLKSEKIISSRQIRWGTKKYSTYYYERSFNIQKNLAIQQGINNSFRYTYNYSSLQKLITKCNKEKIPQEQIEKFTDTYKRQLKSKTIKELQKEDKKNGLPSCYQLTI